MITRRFCPKCGSMLTKSKLQRSENKYDFQCTICEEDFWRFEVLRKHDKERILFLRANHSKKQCYNCYSEFELVDNCQKIVVNYNRVNG